MTSTTDLGATPETGGMGLLHSGAAPTDGFAFSSGTRRAALIYAGVCVVLAGAAATLVHDQESYLLTWGTVSALLAFPAVVFCALAAHRARPAGEYHFWRWCTVANTAMVVSGLAAVAVRRDDVLGLRALALPGVVVVTLLYMRAHLAIMRRRSGGRSIVLDAVETAIATTVFVSAAVLVFGDRLATLPNAWWTLPSALATTGGIIGTFWAVVLHHRTPPQQRRVEALAVVLGVLAILDGAAQFAQGLSGFTLPSSPLLVLQTLTMGVLFLIPLHASRRTVPGLERLSPQQQVRSSRGITIFAIAALPCLGLLALAGRPDRFDFTLFHFAGQATILAVLLALRNLLALDETRRLYRQVEAAAAERQRLLGALSRRLDDDRHRVAAQLHQQAISSYATFSSFILAASRASPSGLAPLPETSERLQADLSRAAETWRELMLAVRPPDLAKQTSAERLTVATSALVMNLVGDGPVPTLTATVDERLHLDWATEALVLRIVQEALTHAHEHRRLARLDLAVAPSTTGIALQLTASGAERDPGSADPDGALTAVRSFVDLSHGDLTVEHSANGVTIAAWLGHLGPLPERPPRLRAV